MTRIAVGFTAARELHNAQVDDIRRYLDTLAFDEYVTGGARGGDAVIGAHLAMTQPGAISRVYVPTDRSQVDAWWERPAFADHPNLVVHLDSGTYRVRNTKIVDASSYLEVFAQYPENDPRSRRSGTWMTKRIAQRAGINVIEHILSEGL